VAVGESFCSTNVNPSLLSALSEVVTVNVVANPHVTGSFSADHTAPTLFAPPGINQNSVPFSAASPDAVVRLLGCRAASVLRNR